jgi:hypothetical protein
MFPPNLDALEAKSGLRVPRTQSAKVVPGAPEGRGDRRGGAEEVLVGTCIR